jgi:aminomethyltransferase
LKKTPLYQKHVDLGGKMIEFGGWLMPVEYSGIIGEHRAVREAAGLFDVSHMGELHVTGPAAQQFIQHLVTNDISGAAPGRCIYSPLCYPDGGAVDDLIVYKNSDTDYFIVVNASNTDKDYDWFLKNAVPGAKTENISDSVAQIAIQGPKAEKILQSLTDFPLGNIRFYHFVRDITVCGVKALVSRTGYTGEDGFEIYTAASDGPAVWDTLLGAGRADGLVPVGLGARDTLRFEAGLPLYGHELSEEITPVMTGLGKFVKLGKPEFIGREALAAQTERGAERVITGLMLTGRGVARAGHEIAKDGRVIGRVTTGNFSPMLGKSLGLALVEKQYAAEGTGFDVMIRGRAVPAVVVPTPFYKKSYKK